MHFPYLFCKEANKFVTLDTLPPMADYIPESMKPDKYDSFRLWYEENKTKTGFDLRQQLAEYCQNDTLILMHAVLAMRKILLLITQGHDVFPKAMSIAGVAMGVYKSCFLKTDKIALIPEGGYEKLDKASDKALKLMNWISKERQVAVQHAGNGREFRVGVLKVDGFIAETNTVLEYLGCYYHSCQECTEPEDTAPNGKLNRINYKETMERLDYIRNQGYQVETFWECEIQAELKHNPEMKAFFSECETEGCLGN